MNESYEQYLARRIKSLMNDYTTLTEEDKRDSIRYYLTILIEGMTRGLD